MTKIRPLFWLLILLMVVFTVITYDVKAETNISELKEFLDTDKTDEHEYLPWYTCGHFTRDLARNASEYNISLGGAICGNHPVFRGYDNYIINYIKINGTLYLIDPQTDYIMQLDEIFMEYRYVKLYPNGARVPSNWQHNIIPSLKVPTQ